ncbi:MAG: TolC family protein, partial [Phycisphaerae bacterium]|nr:TolC family protein [Phycisphaerae bacterium]
FDPTIFADLSGSSGTTDPPHAPEAQTHVLDADVGGRIRTPAGTDISAMLEMNRTNPSPLNADKLTQTRASLSVTQALLQGAGAKVNLASLRQAELDTLSSLYELRGFTLALVADVQAAYWNYILAQRQIEIFEHSVDLAKRQLADIQERINVGRLAKTELAAAEAELALRNEGLIDARSSLVQARLRLLRLVSPAGPDLWTRDITPMDLPSVPQVRLDSVEAHAQLALMKRPDLNQARLLVKRDELEIVKTKNGLLPRLDLFATLGKSGYAESFGRSVAQMGGESYDVLTGVRFEHAPMNRDARARNSRALASRDQARDAVDNLAQLVQVDVRSAYEELIRAREQVAATAATRKLQEENLRAETEKFINGKSTTLLVAQVQRDLLAAQVNEVQAVVAYLNAFVSLFRLDGSLLDRMGIVTPGPETPVRE